MKKAAAICAFGLVLAGCADTKKDTKATTPQTPLAVTVANVEEKQWPVEYEATGTVEAATSAVISARLMGYVREVRVKEGDHVRAGDVLARIDARDLDVNSNRATASLDEARSAIPEAESGVAAAEANLELAQTTYKRMQDLLAKRSVSQQEFDEATAKLKAAQAENDAAKARRARINTQMARIEQDVHASEVARTYADITAPFAGVVTAKTVESGAMATPGAPLLTIEREGTYRLAAAVEESRLGSVRVGQPVVVTLDGIERTIDARVSEIVPSADAASRSYTVKINLPAIAEVHSGLFGRASFRMGERTAIVVPADAVRERGQLLSVFAVENGIAHSRLITTGDKREGEVEVLSGLSGGEKVIRPVPVNLVDGTAVEVRP